MFDSKQLWLISHGSATFPTDSCCTFIRYYKINLLEMRERERKYLKNDYFIKHLALASYIKSCLNIHSFKFLDSSLYK